MNLSSIPGARPTIPPQALASVAEGAPDQRDGGRPRLTLGDAVLIHNGVYAGQVAEVVGWGGRRGVELVVHGPVAAFLVVPPTVVERVEVELLDPVFPRRSHLAALSPAGAPWQPLRVAPGEPEADDPGVAGPGRTSATTSRLDERRLVGHDE
jgi:hypothetical protein